MFIVTQPAQCRWSFGVYNAFFSFKIIPPQWKELHQSDAWLTEQDGCTAITAQRWHAATLLITQNIAPFLMHKVTQRIYGRCMPLKKKEQEWGEKKKRGAKREWERVRKKERERGKKWIWASCACELEAPPGCVFYTDSESALSHLSDNAFIIKFHICI